MVTLVLAAGAAWYGLLGAGPARVLGLVLAAMVLLLATVAMLLYGEGFAGALVVLGLLALASLAGRQATRASSPLPAAPVPSSPVLFLNPKSGGGKALAVRPRHRGSQEGDRTGRARAGR